MALKSFLLTVGFWGSRLRTWKWSRCLGSASDADFPQAVLEWLRLVLGSSTALSFPYWLLSWDFPDPCCNLTNCSRLSWNGARECKLRLDKICIQIPVGYFEYPLQLKCAVILFFIGSPMWLTNQSTDQASLILLALFGSGRGWIIFLNHT